jgi:hypothetical protein
MNPGGYVFACTFGSAVLEKNFSDTLARYFNTKNIYY